MEIHNIQNNRINTYILIKSETESLNTYLQVRTNHTTNQNNPTTPTNNPQTNIKTQKTNKTNQKQRNND